MPIEIKAEDKRIIITGTIKPLKSFVAEYKVKEIASLDMTDCTVWACMPADEINEIPPSATLYYGNEKLADIGEHLQILYVSDNGADFVAEIIKGTISGRTYRYLKDGIGLCNLELYFEYYPVVM